MVKTSPSKTGGEGVIPDQGAKMPFVPPPKKKYKQLKQYRNEFNIKEKKWVKWGGGECCS